MIDASFEPITYRSDLSNYLINRKGQIYSKCRHYVLNGSKTDHGYIAYTLRTDSGRMVKVFAHIATANQFIPNDDPEHKVYVNHIDENKQNPCVDNLEWVTPMGNVHHGSCIERGANKRKKPVNEYSVNGEYIRTWASVRDISRFFADLWGCSHNSMTSIENTIYGCIKGNTETAYRRIWIPYDGSKPRKKIAISTNIKKVARKDTDGKLSLVYCGKVPDEYLYHEPTKREIIDYFLNHERLTDYEKSLIQRLS